MNSAEMLQQIYAANADPKPHVCTPESCPTPGTYYVGALDGPSYYLMAGPYDNHAAALADVDRALRVADHYDGRSWFMSWGTVKVANTYREPGRLNKLNLFTRYDQEKAAQHAEQERRKSRRRKTA